MSAVLFVSAESSSLKGGKVGGVADVVGDVSKALANQGLTVHVVLPEYQCLELEQREHCMEFTVNFASEYLQINLYRVAQRDGVTHYVVSHPWLNSEHIYHDDADGRPFAADASKFALFSLAVAEAINHDAFGHLDVLHLHDWHAASLAVLRAYAPQYQKLKSLRTVYTVHNLALQGTRPFSGDHSSLQHWYSWLGYDGERICDRRFMHCYNPMRAGLQLSDTVHVVSPTYVDEVMQASDPSRGFIGGEGLEHDLQQAHTQGRLIGILNGCDYETKQPRYTPEDMWSLSENALLSWMSKHALLPSNHYIAHVRAQQWQRDGITPWLTSVGRITDQKVALLAQTYQGKLVIDHVLSILAKHGKTCMILGSGDGYYEKVFNEAMGRHTNLIFFNGFALQLGDAIYQLGELFFMPSSFEPCGISQMLAMRSGTPCLVHGVGGLKDTVKLNDNGFVFTGDSVEGQIAAMLATLEQSLTMFESKPKQWAHVCKSAKASRFTWDDAASSYLKQLYMLNS
ncbi:glycogen synthase [Pseudoalteromonas sp. SSDWG2]|uniref:glycogen synthase n=1 Tax=Pseudoalteromonas sp. SSDWG2 TaxID=3139391 RepID=UPI003BAB90DC